MKQLGLTIFCWAVASIGMFLWSQETEGRVRVLFETTEGDFVVELYNETAKHKANFLRLVEKKDYDNVIFHRVINTFVVQAGNLNSKTWKEGEDLIEDSSRELIDAEIMPARFIHERGALAAARESDDVNPERKSSATQFYIVTGKYYTEFDLEGIEQASKLQYTAEQKEAYMFRGGCPELDGKYTVFGRLLSGWKTIDKIQRVKTEGDMPVEAVRIKTARIIASK